jgi:PAS domain S-box-containing protein
LRGEGGGRYRAVYRVVHQHNGRTRWIESHGQVQFEDGIPVRMVGIKQDITDRIEADAALRQSEERFRELANHVDQIVWTCDELGRPTWYNDRWYEFSGTTFEQVAGEGWSALVHPAHVERVVGKFRRCVTTGEPWEDTFPVRGKAGEFRWFLSRAVPIKSADGAVLRWFGTNTDITAQRELQEALTEADRRKDEFLAMLAHELRNPVAPIISVSELLSREVAGDTGLARQVEVIRRQAAHLARLLDDLLDVARITRDRILLRREVFDVGEAVTVALETVGPALSAGGHVLELDTRANLFVDADKDRLIQCLINLLNNAVKFSPRGGRIEVRTRAHDASVVIEVRDHGCGISTDFLPRVFDLFAQADQSLDRKSGGLGVGLSVCKRLVEMHGGSLRAASDGDGRGALFTLTLPLAAAAPHASTQSTAPARVVRRILIVDDNQDAADSISLLLQLSGHETAVVYEGGLALEKWRTFLPDTVLLDIGLPDLDGFEVIRRMRAGGFTGFAIALSGYGQPEDKRRAREAGFDTHLVKPVAHEALESALALAEGRPAAAAP